MEAKPSYHLPVYHRQFRRTEQTRTLRVLGVRVNERFYQRAFITYTSVYCIDINVIINVL